MRAKAFSPAHITGFFKAELEKEEPNQLGSLGAGFSIQKGVKTTVNIRPKTKHDITNYGIRVKGFNTGDIRVSEYVLCGYTKTMVAQIAHEAEIKCKTGLGDVLASYHGGFEIRTKSGAPGIGEVQKIKPKEKLEVMIICFNPISTKKFLKEKISSVNGLGGKMVKKLVKSQDMDEFQDMSLEFAQYIHVITPKMNKVIKELHKNGIKCGIALFGETVFSLVTEEKRQKVLEILKKYDDGIIITSKIDNSGARLE